MARILFTGAGGFIGLAVTEALIARGDRVIATDIAAGPRLEALIGRTAGLDFTPGDIGDWTLPVRLMKDARPDRVVHGHPPLR